MERRRDSRQALKKEVIISCDHVGLIKAQTRDVSYSGVYVSTGQASLMNRAKVDVSFVLKKGRKSILQTIGARVARVDAKGAGLQFDCPLESGYLLM